MVLENKPSKLTESVILYERFAYFDWLIQVLDYQITYLIVRSFKLVLLDSETSDGRSIFKISIAK